MIGLLRALREHEEAAVVDLAHHYGVDYRDRWRRGPDGVLLLSWWRIRTYLAGLPSDSAWARALSGVDMPSATEMLLMQVVESNSGQEHPSLKKLRAAMKRGRTPQQVAMTAKKAERRRDALARKRAAEVGHNGADGGGLTSG